MRVTHVRTDGQTDRWPTDRIIIPKHRFGGLVIWATVCKTVRAMLSVRSLSVLSVTLVYCGHCMHFDNKSSGILHYCGQTAEWMKTPLGTEVDLRAGHIVLDRFPALRERGTAPLPLLGPCLLWPRSPISAGTSQLITRSTRHIVKSCDELTSCFTAL